MDIAVTLGTLGTQFRTKTLPPPPNKSKKNKTKQSKNKTPKIKKQANRQKQNTEKQMSNTNYTKTPQANPDAHEW